MADAATTLAQIDAAISACLTAMINGPQLLEYEINGRRIRRADMSAHLRSLREMRQEYLRESTKASRRSSSLGSLTRG